MQKDEFLLLYNYLLLKDVHVIISIDFGWIVRDLIHFGACGYLFFIDAAAWAFKVDTKAVFWTAVTVTLPISVPVIIIKRKLEKSEEDW